MATDGDLSPVLTGDGRPEAATVGEVVEPPPATKSPAGRAVREVVETLLLAALIFFLVRLVVLNFRVDGGSMLPNLDDGEMLLVNRNAYQFVEFDGNQYYPFDPPVRGDVIVFDPPINSEKPYIKRIIGLPGEEVSFADGQVLINGKPLEEDYIQERTKCGGSDECDVVVPQGSIYVLGDNRTNSSDSRVFGPVPIQNIVGKAWLSYWPPDDFGFVPHENYDESSVARAAASP